MYPPSSQGRVFDAGTNLAKARSVYLKDDSFYQNYHPGITKVAPATPANTRNNYTKHLSTSNIVHTLKPVLNVLRIFGIYPLNLQEPTFAVTVQWMILSGIIYAFVFGFIGYVQWDNVELVRSAEGRFEEAVIDYLFIVYLIPIVINPIVWYQAKKHSAVLEEIYNFEEHYTGTTKKSLDLCMGNKPIMIAVLVPLIGIGTMTITHITMSHFHFIKVIPFCYVNMITYLVGGVWYTYCDVMGTTATIVSEDFKLAIKHVGPSSRVAQYRGLWMSLSKIIRDIGHAFSYTLIFLCLYLFLIITLTIYGLFSQIQEGFGMKDVGLTITAFGAVILLYFICDEAHYASNCVRVNFQKILLLVELNWMNDDAQQEINMFLRATEMNSTNMSLGGFFDVNRNLFKSLLATMVTYLVVLLQFQISIPEDNSDVLNSNSTNVVIMPKPK